MNIRLLVLGLLMRSPQHGYDLQKALAGPAFALWAEVLPGSIYHALKALEREGFVSVPRIERSGHRLKAVYAITPAGRAEFFKLLSAEWALPPVSLPTSLYLRIAFSELIPRPEMATAAQALLARLDEVRARWDREERALGEQGVVPAHLRVFFDNARDHLEADARLLQSLAMLATPRGRRVDSGDPGA